jgi:mono/diheme cytochrome c family protein
MISDSHEPQPVARVAQDDTETAPVPIWLLVLLFLLLYWAMVYFDQRGGWAFDPRVYAPYHSMAQVETWQPASGGASLFQEGKLVYNKPTCVACHQADGNGVPGQNPPLVGSEWVNEAEPGRIIRIVLNGLSGPITVKGQVFGAISMVPWKDVLSDQEIAAVITYVRQNKDWGHKASEVKPEQVKAVRDKLKSRSTPFTADELQKISPAE